MRELVDAERVMLFMRDLGRVATEEAVCYLTGEATAVLVGWRGTRFPAVDEPSFARALESVT